MVLQEILDVVDLARYAMYHVSAHAGTIHFRKRRYSSLTEGKKAKMGPYSGPILTKMNNDGDELRVGFVFIFSAVASLLLTRFLTC